MSTMEIVQSFLNPRDYLSFWNLVFPDASRSTLLFLAASAALVHRHHWFRVSGFIAAAPAYMTLCFLWHFRSDISSHPSLLLFPIAPLISLPILFYALTWWRLGSEEILLQRERLSALGEAWRSGQLLSSIGERMANPLRWIGDMREHLQASRIIRQQQRHVRDAERAKRIQDRIADRLGPAYVPVLSAPVGSVPAMALPSSAGPQPFVIVNNVPRASSGILRGLVMRLALWVIPLGLIYLLGGTVLEYGKRWATDTAAGIIQGAVENVLPEWLVPKRPAVPAQPGRR